MLKLTFIINTKKEEIPQGYRDVWLHSQLPQDVRNYLSSTKLTEDGALTANFRADKFDILWQIHRHFASVNEKFTSRFVRETDFDFSKRQSKDQPPQISMHHNNDAQVVANMEEIILKLEEECGPIYATKHCAEEKQEIVQFFSCPGMLDAMRMGQSIVRRIIRGSTVQFKYTDLYDQSQPPMEYQEQQQEQFGRNERPISRPSYPVSERPQRRERERPPREQRELRSYPARELSPSGESERRPREQRECPSYPAREYPPRPERERRPRTMRQPRVPMPHVENKPVLTPAFMPPYPMILPQYQLATTANTMILHPSMIMGAPLSLEQTFKPAQYGYQQPPLCYPMPQQLSRYPLQSMMMPFGLPPFVRDNTGYKVKVSNVPLFYTETLIKDVFSPFGSIKSISNSSDTSNFSQIQNRQFQQHGGGFERRDRRETVPTVSDAISYTITYEGEADGIKACKYMNGRMLLEKNITVVAQPNPRKIQEQAQKLRKLEKYLPKNDFRGEIKDFNVDQMRELYNKEIKNAIMTVYIVGDEFLADENVQFKVLIKFIECIVQRLQDLFLGYTTKLDAVKLVMKKFTSECSFLMLREILADFRNIKTKVETYVTLLKNEDSSVFEEIQPNEERKTSQRRRKDERYCNREDYKEDNQRADNRRREYHNARPTRGPRIDYSQAAEVEPTQINIQEVAPVKEYYKLEVTESFRGGRGGFRGLHDQRYEGQFRGNECGRGGFRGGFRGGHSGNWGVNEEQHPASDEMVAPSTEFTEEQLAVFRERANKRFAARGQRGRGI